MGTPVTPNSAATIPAGSATTATPSRPARGRASASWRRPATTRTRDPFVIRHPPHLLLQAATEWACGCHEQQRYGRGGIGQADHASMHIPQLLPRHRGALAQDRVLRLLGRRCLHDGGPDHRSRWHPPRGRQQAQQHGRAEQRQQDGPHRRSHSPAPFSRFQRASSAATRLLPSTECAALASDPGELLQDRQPGDLEQRIAP